MSDMIYLDNGATTFPKPEAVYQQMDAFYRTHGVNPGRSGFDLCMEASSVIDDTRKLLTCFFNGTDPGRLVFGYNATDGLNLALFGLVRPGDHVVTTTLEHNSVLRPLYHLTRDANVEVDHVAFDAKGFISPDDVARRFKRNTRLVAVNHGSNVIGTVQDLAAIGERCRARGILFLADVSQTAGKVAVDLQRMHLDVIAFTGHKSLMGPMGIGGLYVREGVEIRHTRAGGSGVRSAQPLHLDEYPYRLEYGTPNLPGIVGLNAGVRWLQEQGQEAIERSEFDLLAKLRDGLRKIEQVEIYCAEDLAGHIGVLSFNVRGLEAADVGIMLDVDYDIACRTGLHCAPLVHEQLGTDKLHGAVRFGLGPFTTEEHVDRAVQAVAEIAALRAARASARKS